MWVAGGSTTVVLLGGAVGAGAMMEGNPMGDSSVLGSPGSAVASTTHAATDTANTIPAIPANGFNMQQFYSRN
jgi:hypothetical protein